MASIRLGKFLRLNLSSSGVNLSGGIKGFRLSIGPRGIKQTVTVPGTGRRSTKTIFSFKKKKQIEKKKSIKSKTKIKTVPIIEDEDLTLRMSRRGFSASNKANKARKHVNEAIDFYEEEAYSESLRSLEEASEYLPDDDEIKVYIAVINYLYIEDYQSALEQFERLDKTIFDDDMLLAMADCYYEVKAYEKSIELLEGIKLPKGDDDEMDHKTLLAKNHIAISHYELAVELLKINIGRKRKMTEELIEAHYYLGIAYMHSGNIEKAKKEMVKVYSEDSEYEDIDEVMKDLAFME